MSHRLTRFVSILVLILSFAFGSASFASAMEPIVPNRSTGGITGGGDSVVLACVPEFLMSESDDALAITIPQRDDREAMLVIEQDSGALYILAGQQVSSDGEAAVQLAATGCLVPA